MSNDLNALRNSTDDFDFDFEDEEDDGFLPDVEISDEEPGGGGPGFLGMTAGERALLLIFFFMNVLVFGAAILIATGRITF